MRYFIIPDLHGNEALFSALLLQEEVPETPYARAALGIHVVQLGDLMNCVRESVVADIQTAALANVVCDTVLVGNHEGPYFDLPAFGGFYWNAGVKKALEHLSGKLRASLLVGDVLLSHAGVTDEWGFTNAAEASAAIDADWKRGAPTPLLGQIGRARNGWHPFGGVLWSDFREPRADFRQVHGHTPIPNGPGFKSSAQFEGGPSIWQTPDPAWRGSIDLDVGVGKGATRIIGLWLEEDGSFVLAEHEEEEVPE